MTTTSVLGRRHQNRRTTASKQATVCNVAELQTLEQSSPNIRQSHLSYSQFWQLLSVFMWTAITAQCESVFNCAGYKTLAFLVTYHAHLARA